MSDFEGGLPPSEFARSDVGRYSTWASGGRVFPGQPVPEKVMDEYKTLMKLVVPSRFLGILRAVSDLDYKPFAHDLLEKLGGTEQTDKDDCNRIIARWPSIADAHRQIAALDEYANDTTLRKAVDPIFVASVSQSGTNAKILYEQNIRLISSTARDTPSPVAIADTLTVYPMPQVLDAALPWNTEFIHGIFAQASWRDPVPASRDPLLMDLLMSAAEYQVHDEPAAYRQLVYDLSTAQSVRRALGLRDVALFGLTSNLNTNKSVSMPLYACWWSGDRIYFSKSIYIFQISQTLDCLEFFNFLYNLNKRNGAEIARDTTFESLTETLKNNQWRAPDRPKRKNQRSHDPNPPPAQRDYAGPSGGIEMQELEVVDNEMSEVSDDYPVSMENNEADCVLGDSGKEEHGFDWITKHVPSLPATDWTSQWAKATQIEGECIGGLSTPGEPVQGLERQHRPGFYIIRAKKGLGQNTSDV